MLSPVSSAWTLAVSKTAPEIDLYFDDNHHPSKEGSYLIACSRLRNAYWTLQAEGAADKVDGHSVEEETGIRSGR